MFDEENAFRSGHTNNKSKGGRNYLFTTEAHIFPIHLRNVHHDVSHRLPPEFYSIKVEDDETNKRRGTFENLKCNNEPWWKDLYAMPYISDMHENIQSVTGISSSQSNVVKKGEIGSSVHETNSNDGNSVLHFSVSGVGEFDVTPFHGGFSVHNQLDGTFLEVSSLGINPIVAYMSRPVVAIRNTKTKIKGCWEANVNNYPSCSGYDVSGYVW